MKDLGKYLILISSFLALLSVILAFLTDNEIAAVVLALGSISSALGGIGWAIIDLKD